MYREESREYAGRKQDDIEGGNRKFCREKTGECARKKQ